MTTDPTITIAGLETRIGVLSEALHDANRGRADTATAASKLDARLAATESERDALAAQLAEVRAELAAAPKVCAIHSYALEGPCMTCGAPWPGAEKALRQERIEGMEKMRRISRAVGCPNSVEEVVEAVAAIKADLASERAHLAACRTRIAGLEQAANERSAEVARLTAERTEWIAAAVAIGERVDHLGPVASGGGDIAPREWIHYAQDLAGRVKARIAGDGRPCNGSCDIALASRQVGPDGIVPRNARECAELWEREAARLWREETRLTARVAELEARPVVTEAGLSAALDAHGHAPLARKVFAHLGPVMLPAQDRAEELNRAYESARCDYGPGVEAMRAALASLGAPATTPTAAPGLVAAVSVDELIGVYMKAYNATYDERIKAIRNSGERPARMPSRDEIAIRAVLARLNATTIAPVDPEAVARAYHASEALPDVPSWTEVSSFGRHYAIAAMRATLTAAGIPVTPEVGK